MCQHDPRHPFGPRRPSAGRRMDDRHGPVAVTYSDRADLCHIMCPCPDRSSPTLTRRPLRWHTSVSRFRSQCVTTSPPSPHGRTVHRHSWCGWRYSASSPTGRATVSADDDHIEVSSPEEYAAVLNLQAEAALLVQTERLADVVEAARSPVVRAFIRGVIAGHHPDVLEVPADMRYMRRRLARVLQDRALRRRRQAMHVVRVSPARPPRMPPARARCQLRSGRPRRRPSRSVARSPDPDPSDPAGGGRQHRVVTPERRRRP
jgi:hypothetical protein